MQLQQSLFLTALAIIGVSAQNATGSYASSVDVKDLSNWSPCAQECFPAGLELCGSLSNTSCICTDIAFDKAIAPCIVTNCSSTERNMNKAFLDVLCGDRLSKLEPAILTINAAVSATLTAAASATPSIFGSPPQLSSFPLCAQRCFNQSAAFSYGCDIAEGACQCEPPFRARNSACQEVTCDSRELLEVDALAEQACGRYYVNNTTLASAVSSAIASATSAASAATKSKFPTNPAEYPPCAQACINKYLPLSDCGSLVNRTCVCGTKSLNSNLVRCEETNCNTTDREKISALSNELCFDVGGLLADSGIYGTGSPTNTSTITPTSLPSPSAFTGHAPATMVGGFAICLMVTTVFLGVVVLGL